ncbi:MAG: DNA polymerase III subunit gamma/tau [Flavobacteriaceae bacterium]|tara:strand:- start:1407 stop:3032 length:1626 start_codon:yes stop_codon:yes gene_type:complete
MSDFLVSARKYRPVNFDDVVGQEIITTTLKNAIKNNKLAQALLFTGPRGVGKTSCARIVAREINNFEIDDDNTYNIFELDAASNNGVEGIRNLIDQTRIPPQIGKYKVYIIDEVHMLSSGAFNAFLKTLEEPPAHCIFILATTEKHKIIPTILSRCQIYNFKRISTEHIITHLKEICKIEDIKYEDDALIQIASKCDGAMRDALQLFDKVIGVNKNITSKIVEENLNTVDFDTYTELINDIKSKDIPKIMVSVNQILDNGVAGDLFLSGLSSFYRDILVSKNKLSHNLLNYEDKRVKTLLSLSSDINFHILIEYINLLNEAEINFQKSLNQRLLIELSILKISSLEFNEEKKKFKYRLIPISNFQSQVFISQQSNAIEQKKPKPIANLSVSKFQTSTLSLKSIEKNKEINDLDLDSEVEYSNNNELILEDIIEVWDNYTNIQEEKGRYNIASILRISSPKFKNNTIIYSVPNNTTSLEIDSEKQNLLLFLRNKLESDIGLLIEIDKKMDENKAYTNKDKFEVLKKKNPLIDELRNTFKLSI